MARISRGCGCAVVQQLWRRFKPLAWELPYAAGAALKSGGVKKKKNPPDSLISEFESPGKFLDESQNWVRWGRPNLIHIRNIQNRQIYRICGYTRLVVTSGAG